MKAPILIVVLGVLAASTVAGAADSSRDETLHQALRAIARADGAAALELCQPALAADPDDLEILHLIAEKFLLMA